jgi:integrase
VHGYADQLGRNHSTPHDVRRLVGTQLAQRDSRTAQQALGHPRIDTPAQHDVVDALEAGLTDDRY